MATEAPLTASLPSGRTVSLSKQGVRFATGLVVCVTSAWEWYTRYSSLPSGERVTLQCPVPEV